MSSSFRHALAVSSLFMFLTACGGGGGGDATAPPGGGGSGGGLNPGVAGSLYFSAPSDNVRLDMPSGIATPLRERDGGVGASASGTEFVAIEEAASGSYTADDLVIYDANGNDITRFEVEGDLHGTPRFSRDGQHIAVRWWPPFSSEFSVGLAIFDRQGKLVRHYAESTSLGSPEIRSWDWEPDGHLLFSIGDTIVRVDPLVDPPAPPQEVAVFPDDWPSSLAVSPDGSRIAFTVGEPGNLTDHVWVMNADGSGQRQLTASTLNETSPAWSPDGGTIAVRQGVTSWASVPTPGLCPTVYLVPADATRATLDEANPAPAYRLRMMEDGQARNVCAFSSMDWR